MSSRYVIIVAGGLGSRMKAEIPKPFLKVNGKEIILYTIKQFRLYDQNIPFIIAVHRDYISLMEEIIKREKLGNVQLVEGGEARFHSVKNALAKIQGDGVVGIHDAARPLVSFQTIHNCFETAGKKGNAIPVAAVNETLREVQNGNSKTVSRENFKVVQTPQCFRISEIQNAFKQAYSESFTDDASVLESAGKKIFLVEGNPENIKITYPHDLLIAKALLQHEK